MTEKIDTHDDTPSALALILQSLLPQGERETGFAPSLCLATV
jgi:hypothetical protein